jgi:hypothetical protein
VFAGDRFADDVPVRYWPACAGAICGESRGSDDMELRADHRCADRGRVRFGGSRLHLGAPEAGGRAAEALRVGASERL